MSKKREELRLPGSFSHGMKWDNKGRCYEQYGDGRRRGRWKRAPSKDFGTQFGDLVIPPWAQQAVAESRKSQRKRKRQ
jgi:hypothetical protein